jgi:hypothetical protein
MLKSALSLTVTGLCLVISYLGSPLAVTAQEHQDSCYDALRNNAFNQFTTLNTSNYESEYRSAVCSSVESDNSNSNGGRIKGFIPFKGIPIPVEAGADWNTVQRLKTQYCSNAQSQMQKSDLEFVMSKTVSEVNVNAWLECIRIKNNALGLKYEIQGRDERNFVLRVQWKGGLGTNDVIVNDFTPASNLRCNLDNLRSGTRMTNNGWISVSCSRLDNAPANLILNVIRSAGNPIIDSISPFLPLLNPPASATEKQEAKVWLHYVGGRDAVQASLNVAQVVKKGVGEYVVVFSRPFRSSNYAIVASSTAGYARISVNTPTSVVIFNHNTSGQLVDSEVFLVAYGEQ